MQNNAMLVIFLKTHSTQLNSPKNLFDLEHASLTVLHGTYSGNYRTKLFQLEYLRGFWEEWDIPGKCPDWFPFLDRIPS